MTRSQQTPTAASLLSTVRLMRFRLWCTGSRSAHKISTVLREPGGDIGWHVLADPEGNEFCAFTP